MRWAFLLLGVLLGVLLLGAARFTFLHPAEGVHHHANFAIFVDGQRLDLSDMRYMEDVAACASDPAGMRPQDRVHLHNGEQDVVHVHQVAATWGDLFANLGLGLGDNFLILDDGRRFFEGEEGRTIKFFLNGQQVVEMANRPVRSEDRVLISVGPETPDQALESQFGQVASSAGEYNAKMDPATCAGARREVRLRERIRDAFGGPCAASH
jgi:hypothetical protein